MADDVTPVDKTAAVQREPAVDSLRNEVAAGAPIATDGRNLSHKTTVALLAAVACVVLGAKLITISVLGSPMPIVDQWDGEAANIYSPYLKGALSYHNLFAPHNEHRLFLTRILALIHLELAGEWNTRLEMVLGALVHTAAITWLTALLMPLVAAHRRIILACFVALLFALPLCYENLLWGFQSQIYFMLLFGIAALIALVGGRAFTFRWFCGLAAAVLGYLSYAASVSSILAAGVVVVLQLMTSARNRNGREYAGLATIGLLAAVMAGLTAMIAHPLSTPVTVLVGLLSLIGRIIFGLLPAVWFCRYTLSRRPAISDRAWFVVGISTWVAIQVVLLAYGRGTGIAVRYFDILLLIYPVGLVAVFTLSDRGQWDRLGRYLRIAAAAWVFAVPAIIALIGYVFVIGAVDWGRSADQLETNVRTYLATGNIDELRVKGTGHTFDLSHPDSRDVANLLADSDIRAILPPEVRPLDADNAAARRHLIFEGKLAGLTATALHLMFVVGPVLLAVGIGSLFACAARIGSQPNTDRS